VRHLGTFKVLAISWTLLVKCNDGTALSAWGDFPRAAPMFQGAKVVAGEISRSIIRPITLLFWVGIQNRPAWRFAG
jgi:hypothetical protein